MPADDAVPLGSLRVGRRTLGTVDDAVLRYRVEGGRDDAAKGVRLVPDTERAELLDASPAGPRLARALERAIDGARWALPRDRGDLRSITLAPDVDAIAGSAVLARLRDVSPDLSLETPLDRPEAAQVRNSVRGARGFYASRDGINGAFNAGGNIVFMPDYSRALLAAVGAYDPTPTEASGTKPAGFRDFMPLLTRHEIEHSVSPTNEYGRHAGLDGLEEGIGEVLTSALPVTAAARHDLPPTARRYGRVDRVSAQATAGWRPHATPKAPGREEAGRESNERYVQREQAIADLLRLAGVNRHTRTGLEQARELLQRGPVSTVPDALAGAIGDKHGLDQQKRSELASAIRDITESSAKDPVGELARSFGIEVR